MSEPDLSTEPAGRQRATSPVELLWDLAFAFAITQVTALIVHLPTWGRAAQAALLLALVWWAWSAFVWAANAHEAESPVLRACLLSGTVLIFVTGLALPHAFGSQALLFAVSYALVRFLHLVVYADASRRGNAAWSAIAGFGSTVLIGMALLVAGALMHGWARAVAWTLAVLIDYAGPAWLTRARLRSLQEVAVSHFADRYGAFVIICLGESVLAIGIGATSAEGPLSAELVLVAALGLTIAIGMWWTYFDRFAEAAQSRLRVHADPVLAAADAYSYMHLVIVAGIIVFAAGIRLEVEQPLGAPVADTARLAMCGGVSLYLVGLTLFGARMLGLWSASRATVAVALIVLFALGGSLPAWSVTALIALMIGAMCAFEALQPEGEDESEAAAFRDHPASTSD